MSTWHKLGLLVVTCLFALLIAALAIGAPFTKPVCQDPGCVTPPSEFPFKSMKDLHPGWNVVDVNNGVCETDQFIKIRFLNEDESVGWQLYIGLKTKIVGVRYQFGKEQRASPNLVVYAVDKDDVIVVVREESYDPARHIGPCQWIDEAGA